MEEIGSRDHGSERTLKKLGLRTGHVNIKEQCWELVRQGAEARIFKGSLDGRRVIAKQRFVKKYRHSILDHQLSRERMRAEARSNVRCRTAGVSAPEIVLVDVEQRVIIMEEVEGGRTLKQALKELETEVGEETEKQLQNFASCLGQLVGKLHSCGMVHGDLTTSNVLLQSDNSLTAIDFGLSGWDASVEEKAVDLYVLERALASSHPNMEPLVPNILEAYSACLEGAGDQTLAKLEEVRLRGRKRSMVG